MKKSLLLFAVIVPMVSWAQDGKLPEALLELVHEHRYPLTVSEAGIAGEGGLRLVEEARRTDVVMFGENHGTREVAMFADALYRASNENGSRLLVTEMSPVTARAAERMLREGSLEGFLAEGLNLQAMPFFSVDAELDLPASVLAAWPDRTGVIWGLDQEFMGGAPLLFGELEKLATREVEREAVASAQRARLLNPFLIGMGSGKTLEDLDSAFSQSASAQARELTRLMKLSHKIYKEQMGGDARWSNARREQLMMENFLHYASREAEWQPLFLKFGATHLFRVAGPTVDEPLGMRVHEWASAQDRRTLNLYADCASGEALEFLLGRARTCSSYLLRDRLFVDALVDNGPTLFDLRPLREHPALAEAPRLTRMVAEGFDYLVLFPDTTAAEYLPGTLVAHRYGAIAAGTLLLLLSAVVLLARKWWRHRRQGGSSHERYRPKAESPANAGLSFDAPVTVSVLSQPVPGSFPVASCRVRPA